MMRWMISLLVLVTLSACSNTPGAVAWNSANYVDQLQKPNFGPLSALSPGVGIY